MRQKIIFWLFITIGLVFGVTAYFINDPQEVKSASNYNIISSEAPKETLVQQAVSAVGELNNLILVNNENKLPVLMEAEDASLHNVFNEKNKSYKVRDTVVSLTEPCLKALNRMMQDFEIATEKHDVIVLSGYRSAAQQQELLDESTSDNTKTAATVAEVGGSEHHAGLAMDLGIYTDSGHSKKFRARGDYAWLAENMYRYGFVVRYKTEKSTVTGITNEPWHIRYVGAPHAGVMEQLGFCLEEYLNYLQSFTASGKHLLVSGEEKSYEIYTLTAQEAEAGLLIPQDVEYTISDDNMGHRIVTMER